MRHRTPLAIAGLLLVAGFVPAQEQMPLPSPDQGSAGLLGPPSSQLPPGSAGQPQPYAPPGPPYYPQPGPFGSGPGPYPPYPPYPPPPGAYPPPPLVFRDPVNNPFFWFGIEGLAWWTRNQPLSVPVVTTGPGSQGVNAGALGMPGTTSLNAPLNYGASGGVRLYAGGWFDVAHTLGLDGSLFVLGQQSAGFSVVDRSGVGNFVINEPVVGAPFDTQVSAPGVQSGNVVVHTTSTFGGGDINFMYNLYRDNGWTVNLLGGYRYLELDESLDITANSNLFTGATYTDNFGNVLATATPGSTVTVLDQFGTRNQFNGAQLGSSFQYQGGRWSIGGAAKVALGDTHEVVTVNGSTIVFPVNSTPVPLSGGNYATLQIGRYTADRFAVAPEGQVNFAYQFTPWLRGQLGYTLFYLSSVVRPGNQIDNTYDGVMHPSVPMVSSSYWAQGLNFGLQFRF